MPGTVDVGALEIQLTATDLAGATTSDSFSLAIVGGDDQLDYSADSVWPQCEADCGPGGDDDNDGHDGHGRDDDDGGNCISERINAGSPGVAGTGDAVDLSGRNRSYGVYDGGAGFDTLNGTDGDDALLLDDDASPRPDGTSGPRLISIEAIDMGAGDDVVDLTSVRYDYGNVAIAGGAGNDVLWSNAGNDQLDGGAGNDQLEAGAGDDVYLHGPNGGADVVLDTGGQDAIQFADGIDAASVSVARSHNDLVLSAGANGSVTVQDWFASGDARVEQVQFADGTVWGESELSARAAAHGGDHHGGGGGDGGCPPGHGDDHHDRGDAEHAGASSSPDARDKHDKRDERDPLADILRRAPHYDFAALTDYLALHEARSDGPLTAEQIAQRWTQVRGSVARLGDNDPYARDGVLDGDSLDGDLAHAGLMNAGWGHSGSTGQVRGAGGLPTLRGLNEGFRRLG
jgi:Ca2+-binding RTX toxin-like protein